MATTSSIKLLQPISKSLRLRRLLWLFALVFGVCTFLDQGAFGPLERYADNLRVTSYSKRHGNFDLWARDHIILITRSDDSFDDLRGQRLPRSYHAKVVRDLTRAGAKVIAFDFIFSSDSPDDDDFAAAVKASGRVVWAGVFQDSDSNTSDAPHLLEPNPKLLKASPLIGNIESGDIDAGLNQITRIRAVSKDASISMPAFSVEIAKVALGFKSEPIRREAGGVRFGSVFVPLSPDGTFPIKYVGKTPGEIIPTLPYDAIYSGAVDTPFYKKNKFFQDKIILIGDVTKAGNDHRATPLGEMAGVEIHAHAVATLLQGSFFKTAPQWGNIAVIFIAAGVVCPVVAKWRAQWATLGILFWLGVMIFFNITLFTEHEIALHLVAPCTAIIMMTVGVLVERSLTVERDKYRAQALLQRYVSPQIANYVLANPDKCLLGGVRIRATVLFSDIRGFTALSEKLSPEEVLGRLNEYFEVMTQAVFRHEGTVDKYIGDAIMALFGAPVPHPDHARRAIETALDMQSALIELQERWKAQGLPIIDIGIGLNTGDMVFGNMGSKDRMDFSVLGDAVNLASRVESLNKEMGSRILITESTYELVKQEIRVRGPLVAHVKGKEESVTVYELYGWNRGETASAEPSTAP